MSRGKSHPGFKGAVEQLERKGTPKADAEREIGYTKAHASPAARKANPRLNRTGGRRGK